MRWRAGWVFAWVCLAVPLFGQDKSAFPFVDLGKAQALIDVMTRENETLRAEAESLRKQAADLNNQSAFAQKTVADLSPLYEEVRARYSELTAISADLVDRTLKAKASLASAQFGGLVKKLRTRLDELGAASARTSEDAQAKLSQAATDEARVVRNTDDIIVLQAAMARTKAQQERLEAVIRKLELLGAQAESSLGPRP